MLGTPAVPFRVFFLLVCDLDNKFHFKPFLIGASTAHTNSFSRSSISVNGKALPTIGSLFTCLNRTLFFFMPKCFSARRHSLTNSTRIAPLNYSLTLDPPYPLTILFKRTRCTKIYKNDCILLKINHFHKNKYINSDTKQTNI